jgi:hypothetical protein
MKSLIALCVLVASAATAQVQIDNRVSSLVVTPIGAQGDSFSFRVTNRSSHAVTAFSLRSIPGATLSLDGHYACDDQCSRSVSLGNNSRPAIKAHESVERSFSISSVSDGTFMAEAALFDDESYEGSERAAAFLLAAQIGRQAEYDRLLFAVSRAVANPGDDIRKTAEVRAALSTVPVNLGTPMLNTFRLWFPALGDCIEPFARFMKHHAAGEKRWLEESIERFAHDRSPEKPTVSQWWTAAEQQLGDYGCSGCANQAMKPKSPAAAEDVQLACHSDNLLVIFSASLDPDAMDEDDGESDLASEDTAAIQQTQTAKAQPVSPPQPSKSNAPPAPTSSASKQNVSPVSAPPPQAPEKPQVSENNWPPNGLPMFITPDGKAWVPSRRAFNGPVPDYMLYKVFFQDITGMGDPALHEPVLWHHGRMAPYHDPRAGGLNNHEVEALRQIAATCNRKVAVLFREQNKLIAAKHSGDPLGSGLFAPPLPGLHEIKLQEKAALNSCTAQLRRKLGTDSFLRLQRFAHQVYHASPGKIIEIPISDDALYASFFRYFDALNTLAPFHQDAQQDLSARQKELRLAGLSEEDQALLKKVAMNYTRAVRALEFPRPVPRLPVTASGLQVSAAASSAAAQPLPMSHAGLAPATSQVPGALLSVDNSQPEEPRPTFEDVKRTFSDGRDQLKTSFGNQKFNNLTAYLHKLYAPASTEKIVPLDDRPEKQANGIASSGPSHR